jgi:hypothetical protein
MVFYRGPVASMMPATSGVIADVKHRHMTLEVETDTPTGLRRALSEAGVLVEFERLPSDDRQHFESWIAGAADDRHRALRIGMLIDTLRTDGRAAQPTSGDPPASPSATS